ncbi:MAG: anti-sigma factor RsbA family regulatory protein [Thermoleophilaceae bacterium]
MPPATAPTARDREGSFRHEALMYSGQDEFLRGTLRFIREGLAAGEPILVVVSPAKIELLRAELNGEGDQVHFADMGAVGANPARIIPAWRDFVDHSGPGRPVRGIGEPISPSRSHSELVECHRHESLLNLAFADTPSFWLMCPYDTGALERPVVEEARRNHPLVRIDGDARESETYGGLEPVAAPFAEPLAEPATPAYELPFEGETLRSLRAFLHRYGASAGISAPRTDDLVLAVSEVAANSVRHGGGGGLLRVWQDADKVICEVRDGGRIDEPLAGRERPLASEPSGRGLWLANHLCELVQIRSFPTGNVVRLHMSRG